jgi:hypothetical protein
VVENKQARMADISCNVKSSRLSTRAFYFTELKNR